MEAVLMAQSFEEFRDEQLAAPRAAVLRFWTFHGDNPEVYALLKRFLVEAVAAGRLSMGIKMLIERVRWYTGVETVGDDFKINNSFAPFYARLLARDFNLPVGFFEVRESVADLMFLPHVRGEGGSDAN
jgi:hypothetical protein